MVFSTNLSIPAFPARFLARSKQQDIVDRICVAHDILLHALHGTGAIDANGNTNMYITGKN